MPSVPPCATRPFPASLLLVACLVACSAPAAQPLAPADLDASVARRAEDPDALLRALELAGLQPLAVEPPTPEDLEDPTRSAYWHAAAWAWSPATRMARRAVAAARARTRAAGAPMPIQAMAESEDLSDPSMFTRATVRFDVLGILGLGPSAAAKVLADAETRAALGALERAVWSSRFEVDADRARLAALRGALARLRRLREEAGAAHERIEILERNGRLEPAAVAAARLAERTLAGRIAALEIEESRAVERLAVDCGLPAGAEALTAPGPGTLDELAGLAEQAAPSPDELLERLPALRVTLLEYALAEARLRQEATARWPGLQLGPHLLWRQSDFLLGALAATDIPWPGSLEGRIAAASEEREAARERTEDALLAACARLDGATTRLEHAQALLEREARPAAAESARLWTAAQARFGVEPAALMSWADALRMHTEALAGLEQARGELALAALELAEATGPAPQASRVALAQEVRP